MRPVVALVVAEPGRERAAWEQAALLGGVVLVRAAGVRLRAGPDALDELAQLLVESDADVMELGPRAGVAALVTEAGVRAWLAGGEARPLAVDPPLARSGGFVVTDPDRLDGALAAAAEDDVLLALDPAVTRLVAPPDVVLHVLDGLDGPRRRGRSVAGRVADLRAVTPGSVPVDSDGAVFRPVDAPAPGQLLVLNGRVLDAVQGDEIVVAVSDRIGGLAELDAEIADRSGRDLARILRYDDAVDDRHAPVEALGPDLAVVPFWTPSFCGTLIRAAEATGGFGPQPDDPVPGHEVSLAVISPRLFAHVEADLSARVVPGLRRWWPTIADVGVRDAFVIKYAAGGQTELRLHHDVAQLSASVKLNDGYDGGRLEFPRQGVSNETVPVGALLAWPSLVTHPHRSSPLRRGVKYSLTIWFELPEQD